VITLAVSVPGTPAPQGSIRSLGAGRPSVHSNASTLLPWRASVIAHIRQAMETGGPWPLEGPVKVGITFYLPKPKSARKGAMWPAKRPDVDKLARACLDALTQSGAIRDDAQVVMLGATKVYGLPGMVMTVRPMHDVAESAA
jgi:Holliday junction resolvase RusA-like endonuclease